MSLEQGMAALREMIDKNEKMEWDGSGYSCGFCDTDIDNGPVFFTTNKELPPVHWECLQDIEQFPDLPKVKEWHNKMKNKIKENK